MPPTKVKKPKVEQKLQVWWIPQVPMTPFYVPVDSVETAIKILDTLADYDKFQLDNNIKPDYSNAGGLNVWEDGEWLKLCTGGQMSGQYAFRDMSDDQLFATVMEVVRSEGKSPYCNLENAIRELQRRKDESSKTTKGSTGPEERARKIAVDTYYAWAGKGDAEIIDAIARAIKNYGEELEADRDRWADSAVRSADEFARGDSQGFKRGVEEAAKVARETNLNVHPECGRSVSRAVLGLRQCDQQGER